MIDESMRQTLYEAQEMFRTHGEMRPILFMKLLNVEEMVIEYPDMETPQKKSENIAIMKNMIEHGELLEYIFMANGRHKNNQLCLVVIRANPKKETQYICSVYKDEDYEFSSWEIFDGSKLYANKNSMNNLFDRVSCKFN
jgi:hypothetical protein